MVRHPDALESDAGVYTWDSVEAQGEPHTVEGITAVLDCTGVVHALRSTGTVHPYRIVSPSVEAEGDLFVRPRSVALSVFDLYAYQPDLEALRVEYVKAFAASQASQRSQPSEPPPTLTLSTPAPSSPATSSQTGVESAQKPSAMLASDIVERFINAHSTDVFDIGRAAWKADEMARSKQKLRCFVELMDNPTVEQIAQPGTGDDLVTAYFAELRKMPTGAQLSKARRTLGDVSAKNLTAWSDERVACRGLASKTHSDARATRRASARHSASEDADTMP